MNKLIQTEICSIIYGDFKGKSNQELFRCPRELDNTDLRMYVNEHRCFLGWEADTETTDLTDVKESEKYIGYYRMYFTEGVWFGRWMEYKDAEKLDVIACHGVDEIIEWLGENFPRGCDFTMREYLEKYPTWGSEKRYLLKPIYSDKYKVMFDTTYGNGDYPIRIYVCEQEGKAARLIVA